ncbi:MAG: hypothetical protein DMF96_19235 [Acidobacteria bacterium]|nr:MAG: hypothetical protein DMF96_19235 [Acidobacteriota bacterium]
MSRALTGFAWHCDGFPDVRDPVVQATRRRPASTGFRGGLGGAPWVESTAVRRTEILASASCFAGPQGRQYDSMDNIHFYIVLITMRQSAVLTSGQALSVRTFEDAASEWTVAADLGTRLRAAVKEEVSRFINAWGIANRK